jgi:hypothetical protein
MTHDSLSQCKEVEHWASRCYSGFVELAGSASWDTGEHNDQPLHSDSKHWGCCWVHHCSSKHCWALLGMVPDCQTATRDAVDSGCHTTVGIEDATSYGFARGTGHGSTDWVAPGFSVENPIEDKHAGGCCFQKPSLGASSS